MATAIQRRGGTTAEHANFTGLSREITVDTDKNTVVVHDGVTAGGHPLATAAQLAAISGTVGNIVADITGVIAGNGLTGGADSGNANLNVGAGYGISVSSDAVSISNADVRGLFSASGDLSYNASSGVFSFTNDAGDIEGVTAGNGLIGGGTTGTVTLNIGAGTGILVNTDDVAVNATYIKSLFSATDTGGDGSFSYSNGEFSYTGPSQAEANARMDAYLVGGGGITKTNGTFSVGAGTGITVNTDDIAVNAAYITSLFSATDAGGDGSFTYSNGVFTYTGPSATEVRAHLTGGSGLTYSSGTFAVGAGTGITVNADDVAVNATYITSLFSATDAGGDGSFSYSNGVFTYTGPSQAEANTRIDARLSGGTGVTYTSGVIAIGQAVNTTSNVIFNNIDATGTVTIEGNLVVNGNTTTISATNLSVEDALIYLNANSTITNPDLGFVGNYNDGTYAHTGVFRDATDGRWKFFKGYVPEPGQVIDTSNNTFQFADVQANVFYGTIVGNVTGTVSSLSNHDTADLAEGTNLYFTAARARGNISVTDAGGDGSLSYDSGTGIITYTGPSQAEANTRIDARISGGAGLTYTSGVLAVGAGTGITVNADNVAVNATYITSLFSASDAGGDGSFSYSNGVFTYTGPSQAEANSRIDARLSGTNGVSYSSGVISLASSTAGAGLTFASGVLAVGAGTGITVNADDVALSASGVAAGTYGNATAVSQVVVDTYGRVTSASNIAITPAVGSITGLGTGVATFLATPSSANLAGAVTDETGSGALVFATSPSLTTPTLGVASATSINKVAFTAPATSATLTLANGSTLATNGAFALTLTTTAASNVTFPTSGTLSTQAGSETLTNKTINGANNTLTVRIANDVSGLGTGVASALAVNTGSSGAFVVNGGALGTPTSGTLTNATGLPVSTGISGLGTGVATFLATPSSANLAGAVTDETGSGALVFATSPTFTTQITTPVIVKSGTTATGNIGQSDNTFNTIFAATFSGTATTARYADLAEKYSADADYEPGTVLHFGGEAEVTLCDTDMCRKVAGVVTTAPAHLMNSELGGVAAAIALQGRVPCKVVGPVAKGDMMVSAGNGRARAEANPVVGSVIGKSLENFDGAEGVIEVAVGRL